MLTQADVHWIELDSVDSTNDYLARAYQQGRVSGCVAVLAGSQTSGRGRAGRNWQSEHGASLCLSVGLPVLGHHLPFLPLCVGVAIAQVLEKMKVPVRLKWPNDLLLGDQKLGGVLCESFQSEGGPVTVVGLGINLLPVPVSGALGGQGATCLSSIIPAGDLPSASGLAQALVPSILNMINMARVQGISAIFDDFSRRDAWLGREVQVLDRGEVALAGIARGIDGDGAYLIETGEGLKAVHAGDLSMRVKA